MAFKESKTELVTKRGREAEENPFLDFIKNDAVKGKTYEDVVHKDNVAKVERQLRAAARELGHGMALQKSDPNDAGKVLVLFKLQDKKAVKPSAIAPPK